MLNFDQIVQFFPEEQRKFQHSLFREYLQYLVLKAIFETEKSSYLSFIGGTCLHICYGTKRFSEDLDFDNFGLKESHFEDITSYVKKYLEKEGFLVELKHVYKGAFRCYVKIPEILYQLQLSPLKDEKIFIQIDTTFQDFKVQKKKYTLNKFGVYKDIAVHPLDILFSQKLITIYERKRLKGRDLYDVSFLSSFAQTNMDYIKSKTKFKSFAELKDAILQRLKKEDLKKAAADVMPFIYDESGVLRVENFIKDFTKAF